MIVRDKRLDNEYWLCDVIRVLDALDEERSKIEILPSPDRKIYNMSGFESLHFKEQDVNNARIFRMQYSWENIICDDKMKEACKTAKLKSIMFRPAILDQIHLKFEKILRS